MGCDKTYVLRQHSPTEAGEVTYLPLVDHSDKEVEEEEIDYGVIGRCD